MGDLTKNLSRHEFECECGCKFDTVDFELVTVIQDCADYFEIVYGKVIVEPTGPNRCIKHNEEIGGAFNSQHIYAKALDFKMKKFKSGTWEYINPDEIADFLEEKYPDKYGIGRYNNRTHFDSRTKKARWDKR